MSDPTWRDVALRAVAMCAHLDARARVAELRADALQTQRDAAVADNAALALVAQAVRGITADAAENGNCADCPYVSQAKAARLLSIIDAPHPGAGYRAKVRAELLRELALERRAMSSMDFAKVDNGLLAEHFEAQAAAEEASPS